MLLGVSNHSIDLVVAESGARGYGDLLLLASAFVSGGNVEDAVRVDVERNLDLRNAAWGRNDSVQHETPDALVAGRHITLALQHVHLDTGLSGGGGRERLRLGGWYRRVARDEGRRHASKCLDAEGQGGYVQQQEVLYVALEDAGLNSRPDGYDLIGIHALVRLLAKQILHGLLHCRHPRHPSDEDHLVYPIGLDLRVLQSLPARADRPLHEVTDQLIHLGSRQADHQVLRSGSVRSDER